MDVVARDSMAWAICLWVFLLMYLSFQHVLSMGSVVLPLYPVCKRLTLAWAGCKDLSRVVPSLLCH